MPFVAVHPHAAALAPMAHLLVLKTDATVAADPASHRRLAPRRWVRGVGKPRHILPPHLLRRRSAGLDLGRRSGLALPVEPLLGGLPRRQHPHQPPRAL